MCQRPPRGCSIERLCATDVSQQQRYPGRRQEAYSHFKQGVSLHVEGEVEVSVEGGKGRVEVGFCVRRTELVMVFCQTLMGLLAHNNKIGGQQEYSPSRKLGLHLMHAIPVYVQQAW